MSCIDDVEDRVGRLFTALALVALLLMSISPSTVAADGPDSTQVVRSAQLVRPVILPVVGPLTDPRAEVSGLTWKGDTLIVLPQDPELFGHDDVLGFFIIPKQEILDAISDADRSSNSETNSRADNPIDPRQIKCIAPGLARIIRGFDGLEAIGVQGNRCYMTIEAKDDTSMAGYLICGQFDMTQNLVRMDMAQLTAIPMGLNIHNIAEESLVIDGSRIITLSEANGRNCNPEPRAKTFDEKTNFLGSLPFPNIEYRVTDATALDEDRRFWVLNYFFPPEREKLQVGKDPEISRFGRPPGQDTEGCVERLLELRITEHETIVRTNTPPLYLELRPDGVCRNWEALVRLDNAGFLVMTDQYPGTLLAFVPNPYH
ncbi:MAG: hypothetical protein KOO60_02210 [Gemmatimonadales bacterium]|nr:hypothetical protein [Gemmatimonadales bacterium]